MIKWQFKFRCWDPYSKQYVNKFRLEYAGKHPDGIIEQCTGLRDKNKQFIYDGDIVKNGTQFNLIEWYRGGFWVNSFAKGVKWHLHLLYRQLQVVGNIHENPELLWGKNK